MQIKITCRHMDLTKNLKEYAEEKIGRFKKYLGNITEANITMSVEKIRHKAEVTLKMNGSTIKAESITGEMYSSIDEVVEKLAQQVRKHKEKTVSLRKIKDKSEETPEIGETIPTIIRNKSFIAKPMSVEEAGMQMDLLGRDFYVFTNASTDTINVLYKMNDDNLGLIEPAK